MDENCDSMLALVAASEVCHYQAAMEATLGLRKAKNAGQIKKTLASLAKMSQSGAGAYLRVLERCQASLSQDAEAVTAAWLKSADLTRLDRTLLRKTADLLGVYPNTRRETFEFVSQAAVEDLEGQYRKLLDESRRLENLQLSSPAVNANDVSRPTTESHTDSATPQIDPSSSINGMLSKLPLGYVDVIRKIDDAEVEMRFSLSNLSDLQRVGMGAGDAKELLVRLIPGGTAVMTAYCVHLSIEGGFEMTPHTPWLVSHHSAAPNGSYCRCRLTICTYQLSRMLWRYLKQGFISLERTYLRINNTLSNLAERCIICGNNHKVRLQRSTICPSLECREVFNDSDFEVHLQDIWQDPVIMDLFLNIVDATAATDNIDMLGGCPVDNELGEGIYAAAEPSVGAEYADEFGDAWGEEGFGMGGDSGWRGKSAFSGLTVLLGCEHAPVAISTRTKCVDRGIFLIEDPAELMVRYVFMIRPVSRFTTLPKAKAVRKDMMRVFQGLRSGAI